jgi:hypothetical protein
MRERTRGLLAMLSWVQTFSGLTNDAKGKAAPLALMPEQIEVYRAALTFVPTGVPVKKDLVDSTHGIPTRSRTSRHEGCLHLGFASDWWPQLLRSSGSIFMRPPS